MKRISVLLACAILLGCLNGCGESPAAPQTPTWTETYSVVGDADHQFWDLKDSAFMDALNAALDRDDMKLDYLHPADEASRSRQLTNNGDSWKIALDVFSSGDLGDRWAKKIPEAESWIGNISQVELSLFSKSEQDAEKNGIYVRTLISLFTPGAEQDVEDAIGLYGDPNTEAVITEGVNQVTVGSVVYSYMSGNKRFLVEPYVADWPEEEAVPDVIRPST